MGHEVRLLERVVGEEYLARLVGDEELAHVDELVHAVGHVGRLRRDPGVVGLDALGVEVAIFEHELLGDERGSLFVHVLARDLLGRLGVAHLFDVRLDGARGERHFEQEGEAQESEQEAVRANTAVVGGHAVPPRTPVQNTLC